MPPVGRLPGLRHPATFLRKLVAVPPVIPPVPTTPVSNSFDLPIEASGPVVLTLDLPIEACGAVALILADPVEAAGGAARTSSLPVEALGGIVQTSDKLGPLPVATGYATVATQIAFGGKPWTNPGNAAGPPDGSVASVTIDPTVSISSDQIFASGYGFAVDATLPVVGIQVDVRGFTADVAPSQILLVSLVDSDGNVAFASKAESGGPADLTFGGPSDRWGTWGAAGISAARVNTADFGVRLFVENFDTPTVHAFSVDAIQVTIFQPGGAINVESLGAAASARSGPVEAAGAAAQPLSLPIEATQVAATSSSDPVEAIGGVSAAATVPIEATGGIAALAASVLEALQGLAQSALAAIEAALGLSTSASDPVESAQGVAATGSEPVEAAGAVAATAADPLEALGGVASATSDPVESLQTGTTPVSQTGTLAIEATLGVQAPASLQLDAGGGVSTAPDLPVETVQPLSQATTAPTEALLGVDGPTVELPLDVLGSLLATGTLPVEAAGFTPLPVTDDGGHGGGGFPSGWRAPRRIEDDEDLVVLDLFDLL